MAVRDFFYRVMSKEKQSKTKQVAKSEPDEHPAGTPHPAAPLKDPPMFSATIGDPRYLSHTVSMVSSLMDVARIDVRQDGLYIRGMDPSHVALIDVHLPTDAFVSYAVEKQGTLEFLPGEMVSLLDTMPRGRELSMIGTNVQDQCITLVSGAKNSATMRLVTENIPDCPLPKIGWQADITMERSRLLKAVADVSTVSEYVSITVYKNGLLEVHGNGDKGDRKIGFDEEIDVNYCDGTEKASVMLSIDYLRDILKRSTSDYVTLRIADAKPICVSLSAFDVKVPPLGMNPVGRVDYYMAPRVPS